MRPHRRAFTLVELLVSISIITVLVAILLPVVGKARGQARLAICLSNERQIGTAVHGYVSDFKSWLPISGRPYPSINDNINWLVETAPYLGNPPDLTGYNFLHAQVEFYEQYRVFRCAEMRHFVDPFIPLAYPDRTYGGFGWSQMGGGYRNAGADYKLWRKRLDNGEPDRVIASPSTRILAGDTIDKTTSASSEPGWRCIIATDSPSQYRPDRHSSAGLMVGGAYMFADGHARVINESLWSANRAWFKSN